MPIKIPDRLPAREALHRENIFTMECDRAVHQDIRPLRIAILNLMPTKLATETQLLRLLGNTPLQVEVTLVRLVSHESRHTPVEHLRTFYLPFAEVRERKFDALIVTGAPVEHLAFEEVDYWRELTEVFDWGLRQVFSLLYVCWGAQAALYHQFGIPKHPLPAKQFGVFPHRIVERHVKLLRGFDDVCWAPHSRHTETRRGDLARVPELRVLVESDEAGPYVLVTRDGRQVFLTGHSEYDPLTLHAEYQRDVAAGVPVALPVNYYPDDDPAQPPVVRWRGHAHLLFANWINYCVYQETPYDIDRFQRFSAIGL
jgi:homoserine O-succinyltransferase